MNRIKEAFLIDEMEEAMKASGSYFDEPEKVIKRFAYDVSRISELDEMPTMFRDNLGLNY